jgi:hypothetical protein
MADHITTWDHVRRFVLARQHLLRRAPCGDMGRVVDDCCGLQSQVRMGPSLMLWARLAGFRHADLEQALYVDKTLVRLWLMRSTVHIIPSASLPLFGRALRRNWDNRWVQWMDKTIPRAERQAAIPLIMDVLAEPGSRQDIVRRLGERHGHDQESAGRLLGSWGGVLREMSGLGMVICAEEVGATVRFARVDRWLPGLDLDALGESEALGGLLLRYLAGYGPATAQDFAYWAGMDAAGVRSALQAADASLARVQIAGDKAVYLMRGEDLAALAAVDCGVSIPPRLLPRFDVLLLGYRDKQRFLAVEHYKKVSAQAGDIRPVFMLDGRVRGTWDCERRRDSLVVTLTFFEEPPATLDAELVSKAEDLARWWQTKLLRIDVSRWENGQ